jgi:hypothetical protein
VAVRCSQWLVGKPDQSAYLESFNGRLRDECLNEHRFSSLAHTRVTVEAWRREYHDERFQKDKSAFHGLIGINNVFPIVFEDGRKLLVVSGEIPAAVTDEPVLCGPKTVDSACFLCLPRCDVKDVLLAGHHRLAPPNHF